MLGTLIRYESPLNNNHCKNISLGNIKEGTMELNKTPQNKKYEWLENNL